MSKSSRQELRPSQSPKEAKLQRDLPPWELTMKEVALASSVKIRVLQDLRRSYEVTLKEVLAGIFACVKEQKAVHGIIDTLNKFPVDMAIFVLWDSTGKQKSRAPDTVVLPGMQRSGPTVKILFQNVQTLKFDISTFSGMVKTEVLNHSHRRKNNGSVVRLRVTVKMGNKGDPGGLSKKGVTNEVGRKAQLLSNHATCDVALHLRVAEGPHLGKRVKSEGFIDGQKSGPKRIHHTKAIVV